MAASFSLPLCSGPVSAGASPVRLRLSVLSWGIFPAPWSLPRGILGRAALRPLLLPRLLWLLAGGRPLRTPGLPPFSGRSSEAARGCLRLIAALRPPPFHMPGLPCLPQDSVGPAGLATLPAKPQDTLDLCQLLNNDLAATVKKYPKRFIGLGTLPMQAPDLAVKEMHRCVKELGFPGVQIGSHVNNWDLNVPELFPVYAAAEQLNCCIFVHPWDMQTDGRMSKYWLPWLVGMPSETTIAICSMIMGGIFEMFPKLRVCFAHGGGSFPFTLGRISHGFKVRPDLCALDNKVDPKKYLGSFYTDSLVHDPQALKLLINVIGKNKVMLGTDYPFPLGEQEPGKLIDSMEEFDEDLKDKLKFDNALTFLNLDRKQFELH